MSRPSRHQMVAFGASWAALGVAYLALRLAVLHPYARFLGVAPVFLGAGPLAVRLTAVAALADVARLLVFPLALRADYSPNERTLVTSPFDGRLALGLLALTVWAALLVLAWRRGRTIEAFGLGWVALAFLPVANILFPSGILLAERTLYLPSAGLALAAGAWLRDLPHVHLRVLVWLIVLAGGVRTALRVPAWRDDRTVTLSVLEDSPRSYRGPLRTAALLLGGGGNGEGARGLSHSRSDLRPRPDALHGCR